MTQLRRMREKRGITQAKLSEMSGVNLRTVKAYDSGERDINGAAAMTVKNLADAIGCQMEEIMEIPEDKKTVWYVVIDDDTDYGAVCDVESFTNLEEAKEKADMIYNRLTGAEIRKRTGLCVLETDEKDSIEGNEVYRLI